MSQNDPGEALDPEDRHARWYASIQGEEFTSVVLAGLLEMVELCLEEHLGHSLPGLAHFIVSSRQRWEKRNCPMERSPRALSVCARTLSERFLYQDLVNKRRVLLHCQTGDLLIRYCGDQAPRFATQLAIATPSSVYNTPGLRILTVEFPHP